MSADRRCSTALLVLACGLAGGAAHAETNDEAMPDLALLEYLGSWEESDEEWLLFSEENPQAAGQDEDSDDTASDDASQETGHES